jgi:glycine C-acetyltransferase
MLYDEGVFALPIVFPMVARDKARIRTMMNAGHTRADLDVALAAFEKIGRKLNVL